MQAPQEPALSFLEVLEAVHDDDDDDDEEEEEKEKAREKLLRMTCDLTTAPT
jgi:hypothetical protein